MHCHSLRLLRNVAGWLTCAVLASGHTTAWGDDQVIFGRDIRPILSDRCFACHGPDANTREAELRLDVREEAIKAAIVPGSPEESELIARVASDDEELVMPPSKAHKKPISAEELTLLKAIGHSPYPSVHRCRRSSTRVGQRMRSTTSSWRSTKSVVTLPTTKRIDVRLFAGCRSMFVVCHQRLQK